MSGLILLLVLPIIYIFIMLPFWIFRFMLKLLLLPFKILFAPVKAINNLFS